MAEKKAKKSKIKSEKKRNDDIMDSGSEDEVNVFQPSKVNWGHMISTGSTLLDLAISGQRKKWGGLPTGILVEIAGESSSGKCFSRNNNITYYDGIFTVDEFFEKAGHPAFKVAKTVVLEKDNVFLTNKFGEKENVKALTFNGFRHVKKITTKNGIEHEITMNHPLKVMTKNGNVVWKQANDIQIGEHILYKRGFLRDSTETEMFGKNDAYVAGMLIADGYLKGVGGFTNNEPFLMSKMIKWLEKNGIKYYTTNRERNGKYSTTELKFTSRSGHLKVLDILQLPEKKSAGKVVPLIYRSSGKQIAISFIKGYFDCEGHFTSNSLEVASASKVLISQIQQMLIGIGVLSSINKKSVPKCPDNNYWRLNISGTNFVRYIETVGSLILSRKDQFKGYDSDKTGQWDLSEVIPHQKNNFRDFISDLFLGGKTREEKILIKRPGDALTKQKLLSFDKFIAEKKLILDGKARTLFNEWMSIVDGRYFFSEVVANELLPEKDWTYDVSMEKTASFLLNGCVSHNTAILTEIAARGQKKGGDVFFCDPEARLDKEYAEITGLNIRDMGHYEQPDTVTELFEFYNGWEVDPEVPNVFAGDSLAALSTKMEMEDGDKMGMRRAKEFSEGLRKTCRTFAKKNVLMVCSNQIRDGGPHGTKTIPGGNAVPFYSSVRMRVSPGYPKSKIVKEKTIRGAKQKKVIGIQSLVKITKNSLDDPFREVPIFLIFGYGIDDVRGNLTWFKDSNNSKKFLLPDGTEQSSIDKAIEYVEENGLEKKLRIAVRKLWLEIEESFKTQRKPKEF